MKSLEAFSDAGTPLLEDFGTAAPSLTDATKTLTPFSEALTVSLKSLGDAGEASGPIFAEADPVVKKARDLAKSGVKPTGDLAKLLVSLKKTGGWDGLTELIYNSNASLNGFDRFGHFGRTRVTLSSCVEYQVSPAGYSGCVARFNGAGAAEASSSTFDPDALLRLLDQGLESTNGGSVAASGPSIGVGQGDSTEEGANSEAGVAQSSKTEGTEPLLDYLLGP